MTMLALRLCLSLLLGIAAILPAAAQDADPSRPLWMRTPAISPDGSLIAFVYRGQLWLVPSAGGDAVPLTERHFRSTRPVWSPDSRHIAFASDRFGPGDVFIAPVDGGAIRRLTSHSLPEFPTGFTPDGKHVLFDAARGGTMEVNFFDGLNGFWLGQLRSVPVEGGRERIAMPIPGRQASMSPDGRFIAHAFIRSLEVGWRKRQISDGTTDIWVYDRKSSTHRQLTTHRGSEREPVFSRDGRFVYFTAEMPATGSADVNAPAATFNVWRRALAADAAPEQVTFHTTLPVRGLSIADDGTLVYGFDGEIWRLAPGTREPARVPVRIRQGTLLFGPEPLALNGQISEIQVSPSGTELALLARGDVFIVSAATGRTRRVTATAAAERSVSFSPDGRRLLYASERNGAWELFQTEIVREGDKSFLDAAELREQPLLSSDRDLLQPSYSPTGHHVAFRHDRNALRVLDLRTGAVTEVLPDADNYSYSEGDLSHEWAPDGRHIVTTAGFTLGNPEVVLIDIEDPSKRTNISANGFGDSLPRVSRDGRIVYWITDFFGPRQLDESAASVDVMGAFLTEAARAAFTESPIASPEAQAFDPARAAERTVRLTRTSDGIVFADLSKDNRRLTVLSLARGTLVGASIDTRSGASRTLFQRPVAGNERVAVTNDGEAMFVSGGGSLARIDLATGAATPVPLMLVADFDPRAEMEYLFHHQWRLVQSKFYDAAMHGVDWVAMRERYARHLPHISHWEDFAELVAEMQGELNASHMFSTYAPENPRWDVTASLGLHYDTTHEGEGVRVAGVMPGGPTDRPGTRIAAGTVILAVDGTPISARMDIHTLLNRAAGKPLRLGIRPAGDTAVREEMVVPVSLAEESALAYRRWVDQRRAITDRLSNGRVAYVHVAGMNGPEMQKVHSELLGRFREREAAVVDVRFNVGGYLHDRLITFLSGNRHTGVMTRNGVSLGSAPFTRWAKPSAVIANAFSYSDGSIFPFFYRRENLGPMVGDHVPGTGTAVYNINQLEPRLYFAVAQLGFRTLEGQFLENLEIAPTTLVPTEPNAIQQGRDPQLEAAIAALLAPRQR